MALISLLTIPSSSSLRASLCLHILIGLSCSQPFACAPAPEGVCVLVHMRERVWACLCVCARAPTVFWCSCACVWLRSDSCFLPQGCYFIDRSPKLFHYVLDYLRGHELDLPETQRELLMIWHEAVYYQLDGLKLLLERHGLVPKEVLGLDAEDEQLNEALVHVFSVLCAKEPASHGLFRLGGIVTATITARFSIDFGEGPPERPCCHMKDTIELGVASSRANEIQYLSSSQVTPTQSMRLSIRCNAATHGLTWV